MRPHPSRRTPAPFKEVLVIGSSLFKVLALPAMVAAVGYWISLLLFV